MHSGGGGRPVEQLAPSPRSASASGARLQVCVSIMLGGSMPLPDQPARWQWHTQRTYATMVSPASVRGGGQCKQLQGEGTARHSESASLQRMLCCATQRPAGPEWRLSTRRRRPGTASKAGLPEEHAIVYRQRTLSAIRRCCAAAAPRGPSGQDGWLSLTTRLQVGQKVTKLCSGRSAQPKMLGDASTATG